MNNRNVAEQLIEKGLATALRHKRDDEDRSSDYDKLMAAEQAYAFASSAVPLSTTLTSYVSAVAEGRGIHSEKEQSAPKPPVNISEVRRFPASY